MQIIEVDDKICPCLKVIKHQEMRFGMVVDTLIMSVLPAGGAWNHSETPTQTRLWTRTGSVVLVAFTVWVDDGVVVGVECEEFACVVEVVVVDSETEKVFSIETPYHAM